MIWSDLVRWALLLLLSSGCTSKVVVTCTLDPFVAADVANANAVDCAAALSGGDGGTAADPWTAAQQCVLDAVAAGQPFQFVYDVPGTDTANLRAAFDGRLAGGKLVVTAYAFSVAEPGDVNPSVSKLPCDLDPPVVDSNMLAPCTPDVGRPCLACRSSLPGQLLCGVQP